MVGLLFQRLSNLSVQLGGVRDIEVDRLVTKNQEAGQRIHDDQSGKLHRPPRDELDPWRGASSFASVQ